MKILFIAALLCAIDAANADPALAPSSGSLYAVDLSVEANADALSCLKKSGYMGTIPVERGNSTEVLFKQFVSPMQDQGVGIGFHTTREDWKNIIDAPGFAGGALLWYSSVRGEGESGETPANFKDFVSFYPFPGASVKQIAQGENVCGLNVNRDIYYVGRASKPAGEQLGAKKVVVGKTIRGARN